jgi:general secretion pathway protein H
MRLKRQLPIGSGKIANGYTLLELLVVLAIIAVISLAVPMLMLGRGSGIEARNAATRLADVLRATRADAQRLGAPAKLTISDDGTSIDSELVRRAVHVPRGIALTIDSQSGSPGSQASTVTFFPDGSANASDIRLSARGQVYNIVVRPLSGRISIEEGK